MLTFVDLHNREWTIDFTDSETVQRIHEFTGIDLHEIADEMVRDPLAAIERFRVFPSANQKYFDATQWLVNVLRGIDPNLSTEGMLDCACRGALEIAIMIGIRIRWPATKNTVTAILTQNFASARMAQRN